MRTALVTFCLLGACHHGTSTTDFGPDPFDAAAMPDASGVDATFVAGMPITATPQTWTWVPFTDAQCGDGSATGIGVNLSTASSRVLVYLEGGGACWDEMTCYTLMTAANFSSGYGETQFMAESTDTTYLALPGGFFDRTAATNPFKDYSFVYVPYCTGDNFEGDNVATYGSMMAHHVGFKNMTAFLSRLVPTFPSADRVYLAGSSAGGFGALYNWEQAQNAFGTVRVDLIDDSGTFMPPDVLASGSGSDQLQRTSWNLAATEPAGCGGCASDLDSLYGYYGTKFSAQRLALLSYQQDTVLPTEYGISQVQFGNGLAEEEGTIDTHPSVHYFIAASMGHVLFFTPGLTTKTLTLATWLGQMVSDDTAWTSETP